jgi:hypothetical protein
LYQVHVEFKDEGIQRDFSSFSSFFHHSLPKYE